MARTKDLENVLFEYFHAIQVKNLIEEYLMPKIIAPTFSVKYQIIHIL